MNLDTFFEKFELFADAPNAVAKMRELILWLAFAGAHESQREEWPKCLLKKLATKIGSGSTPDGGRESYFSKGIPLIRSMNVHFGGFRDDGLVYLNDEQAAKLSNVTVQENDVLLNITGASIGRVTIAPQRMAGARVNQHVTIIRCKDDLDPIYLSRFLASPLTQNLINEIQVGATRQALTKSMIEEFEIPLPPLAEQKRIVAKVDELMALCDRLEAQQQERETRHTALAQASLTRFADAPTPANLELLFHKSYSIEPAALRKSILVLAFQGRLTDQDPQDRSVEALLTEIAAEKEYLIEQGILKRSDSISIDHSQDLPWVLPAGWLPVSLSNICTSVTDGDHLPPPKTDEGVPFLVIGNVRWGGIEFSDCRYVSHDYYNELNSIRQPRERDILYTLVGSFGIPVIVDTKRRFCVQRHIGILRPSVHINHRFLAYCLQSQFVFDQVASCATGIAQKTVPLSGLRRVTVPLPPLPEQKRIVAKVEQLMGLVDRLEAQLVESRGKAAALLEAVVAELSGAV